jgi:ribose transport system permease protein
VTNTPELTHEQKSTEKSASTRTSGSMSKRFQNAASTYGVVWFLLLMVIVFAIVIPDTFPTIDNFRAILGDQSIPAILALAAILPLAAGEFDLSLGATLGFSAILAITLSNTGLPLIVVLVAVVACGLLIGAVNAVLVVKLGVNAFIATLAVATVLAGLNLFVTSSSLLTVESQSYQEFTTTVVVGIQVVLVFAVVTSLVLWYVMEHTPYGRYLRATGMGRDAARLSGVRTNRYLSSAFVIAGGLAAFAGLLLSSRSGTAPPTLGPEYLLPAYAAAFLGATTIKPGYFNVGGTLIGVLLLAVGSNGLTLLGAETWVTNIFNGLALMLAVSLSVQVARRRDRARRA